MNLVLDVQGFTVENKRFIVKELASFDGSRISHYIFKPPFPRDLLPDELQRQTSWLTEHHHCIEWASGYTPLHQVSKILQELTSKADRIFVKGKEKADYLRKYSTKPITELDEHPRIIARPASCLAHTKNICICALSNVYFLYDTFIMS